MTNGIKKLALGLEIVWWLVTAVVVLAVLLPIYQTVPDYPFWSYNILYIALLITYTRYMFLLKYTWFAKLFWIKIIFIFTSVPVTFLLIEGINLFQVYLDEEGMYAFLNHLSLKEAETMSVYIRTQMIFFGTGTVIASIAWPIRLIISIWRVRNRGTV
jgi:hypothetical protein